MEYIGIISRASIGLTDRRIGDFAALNLVIECGASPGIAFCHSIWREDIVTFIEEHRIRHLDDLRGRLCVYTNGYDGICAFVRFATPKDARYLKFK